MLESSIKAIKKSILMFVEAESWAECKQVVEAKRNLLLTETADQVLAAWIQQSVDNPQAARVFQEYRVLLTRCRQEGIEVAFADRIRPSQAVYDAVLGLVQTKNWQECQLLVERQAKLLLNEGANQVLLSWIKQSQQDPHAMRVFNEYRELLLRCRQEGIEAAFATRGRPSKAVFEAVRLFIEAKDEATAKKILTEKRQFLFSQAADQVFVLWLKQAQGNGRTIARLNKYRAWLARQRDKAGPSVPSHSPQALSEAVQAFVRAGSWPESKQIVLAQQTLLLSDMADQVFVILLKQAEHDRSAVRMLREHRDLLDKCRSEGIEAAFASIQSATNALSNAVQAFIDANSWSESQKIVEAKRDVLLSEEADQFLAHLLTQHQDNPKMLRVIQEHRQLLRRCRVEGIESAFTQPLQPLQTLSETLLCFVDAIDDDERKQLIEKHHELLLTEQADKLFTVLIEQSKKDPARVKRLQHYRKLLNRCRTDGVTRAFSQPIDQNEVTPDLRARLMAVQSQKEFDDLINAHPELLSVLEEIDLARNQATDTHDSSPSMPNEELAKTLFTFVTAQSWPESKAYLENHPELLTTEADRMLVELLAQHATDEKEVHSLQEHRRLLGYARLKGVQAAFAKLAPAPRHVIPSVRKYLNAQSLEERKQIVEAERDLLLSDAADDVLANLQASYPSDSNAYTTLSKQRALLAQARRKGIETAFAHSSHTPSQQMKQMAAQRVNRNDSERSVSHSNPVKQPKNRSAKVVTTREQQDAAQEVLSDDWQLEMTPNGTDSSKKADAADDYLSFDEPSQALPQKQTVQKANAADDYLSFDEPSQALPQKQAVQKADAADDWLFDGPSEEKNAPQKAETADDWLFEEPSEEKNAPQKAKTADDWLFEEPSEEKKVSQKAEAADDWLFDADGKDEQSANQAADEDTILETVLIFVEAKSWAESKRLVEQHRNILLTDEAEQMLKDLLAQYKHDTDIARLLAEHYNLLQRIRRDGIDAAFAKSTRAASRQDIPEEFSHDLQAATAARERIKSDNRPVALNAAVQAWQQLFNRPNIQQYPDFRSDVQSELGSVLLRRYWEMEEASDLNAAIQAYQQVLEHTPRNAPSLPGRLNNLGLSLRARFALHHRKQDVNAAIMAYRQALKIIALNANERPSILNNLGVALTDRYGLERNPKDLNAAILTYEDALKRLPQHATNRQAIEENLKLALKDRFKYDQFLKEKKKT